METKVQITLADGVYEKVLRYAEIRNQNLPEAISNYLAENLPPLEPVDHNPTSRSPLATERDAFLKLHPELVTKFMGEYVAIFKGEVIDHDPLPEKLSRRVRAKHPDQLFLIRKVEEIPEKIIHMRSPRLIR